MVASGSLLTFLSDKQKLGPLLRIPKLHPHAEVFLLPASPEQSYILVNLTRTLELALDIPHFPDADYKHLETPNARRKLRWRPKRK